MIFSEFHDCFGKIETLNTTHRNEVKDNVKPVVTPVRKVPYALKPKLGKELKRTTDLGIIEEPIKKPTDWVNGLVSVEKPNGKLHICLDPRALNNAIKREHLYLPTAKEIFSQMSSACFFSKLDELPYGVHSAREVFQREITFIILDVSGSANSQDDMIVWGRTLAEHNERLNKVFLKIRKSGLKLNKQKCQIGVTSIAFLGHIISSEGLKVNPAKIEAITKMPLPNFANELQRFLGMIINYTK